MLNAHNIAQQYFLGKADRKPAGDLEQAERLIDHLATLHALQYSDPGQLQLAADVLRHERTRAVPGNGIDMLLAAHQTFKDMSLEQNFEGNKVSTMKGFTKENFSPNVSVRTAPVSQQREMEQDGYVLKHPLGKDKTDPNPDQQAIYISRLGTDRYRSGLVSLTNMESRGTDLLSNYKDLAEDPHIA
ncbi:MAG: hypothetical protein GY888_24580, partial [Planctomycetaceae bacterium]|nr:hypothetical protein [Planctomycetaceae bacterium]